MAAGAAVWLKTLAPRVTTKPATSDCTAGDPGAECLGGAEGGGATATRAQAIACDVVTSARGP